MKYIIIFMLTLISGCGTSEEKAPPTHPEIVRGGFIIVGAEHTPIQWNGNIYIVLNAGDGFWLVDFETKTAMSRHYVAEKFDVVSAIVDSGTLYVFGSNMVTPERALAPGGQIIMTSSTDLFTWTRPVVVIDSPEVAIGNTSVTKTPDGFVMAYDTRAPGYADYSYRFAYSRNMVDWVPIGGIFSPYEYTSCPAIRYVNGYYYVFHLRSVTRKLWDGRKDTKFVTMLSRSTDLITFENQRSAFAVMSPVNHPEDGTATTDLDLVEFQGKVYLTYSAGDQQTWGHLKYAIYNGDLTNMLALFF